MPRYGEAPLRRRVVALPLQQVGPVDRRGGDVDDHLVGLGLGVGDLLDLQHLGAAGLGDDDCAHGLDRSARLAGPAGRRGAGPPGPQPRLGYQTADTRPGPCRGARGTVRRMERISRRAGPAHRGRGRRRRPARRGRRARPGGRRRHRRLARRRREPGRRRRAALRHLDRVRRAGHQAHPARAARPAAALADPLARGRQRPGGRARGRAGDDAAAPVDPGHRAHRRARRPPPRPWPRCSSTASRRSCTSSARSAAPATSRRWPTSRWP